jgi:hypothetical protein
MRRPQAGQFSAGYERIDIFPDGLLKTNAAVEQLADISGIAHRQFFCITCLDRFLQKLKGKNINEWWQQYAKNQGFKGKMAHRIWHPWKIRSIGSGFL